MSEVASTPPGKVAQTAVPASAKLGTAEVNDTKFTQVGSQSLATQTALNEAANNLYMTLRKIKNKGFKSIVVNKIPNIGVGLAINDRLKRASNK